MAVKISASLFACPKNNFLNNVNELEKAGLDMWHIDVMDNKFVPNTALEFKEVELAKQNSKLPLDIHFMVENPIEYINKYKVLKPYCICVHIELEKEIVEESIRLINDLGIKAGLVINPKTKISKLEKFIKNCKEGSKVEKVLIMTVEPGYSGQSFVENGIERVEKISNIVKKINPYIEIEVDGGVNGQNANELKKAGANILVSGSFLFKSDDFEKTLKNLKK